MKNTSTFKLVSLIAFCGATLTASGEADARGFGAVGGFPTRGSDANCFTETWGGVTNTCSSRKGWVMALPYDSTGRTNVQVAAAGVKDSTKNVGCRTYAVDPNGLDPRQSSNVSTTKHDGKTEILKMSVNAHGYGAVYVICQLDPGTILRNVHFNQGNVPL